MTHRAPSPIFDSSHAELAAYATRHEISIEGHLRETYIADTETEIGWPIYATTPG